MSKAALPPLPQHIAVPQQTVVATRLGVWFVSVLLGTFLILGTFLTAAWASEHLADGSVALASIILVQHLALQMPLVLVTATIIAHFRAGESARRAMWYYAATVSIILAIDIILFWATSAPRILDPGPAPGADFSGGVRAILIALLGPPLVLFVEIALKLLSMLKRTPRRRPSES